MDELMAELLEIKMEINAGRNPRQFSRCTPMIQMVYTAVQLRVKGWFFKKDYFILEKIFEKNRIRFRFGGKGLSKTLSE
jgi:hypothetical protein